MSFRGKTQRRLSACLIFFGVILASQLRGQPQEQACDPALRKARLAFAHKPRRIVFNNDGDDHLISLEKLAQPGSLREKFFAQRTTPLLGTQVDAISYCTNRPLGLTLHPSRHNSILDGSWKDRGRHNLIPDLRKENTDVLKLMTEFCRDHKLDIFWSMRMNDIHDSAHSPEHPHPYFVQNAFKQAHPEYFFGTRENRPARGGWTSLNFAIDEVRENVFQTISEVVHNYDVDGVELDFFRHLVFFRSVADGNQASDEERTLMTGLVRRIRRMLDQRQRESRKPLLLIVRVPDGVDFCRAIGLELDRWLEEDLLDIVVAGGDFRLNLREHLIKLGKQYKVPVWCDLDPDVRFLKNERFPRNDLPTLRGRAGAVWAAGASAVYTFNFFNPHSRMWAEMGNPQEIAKSETHSFLNVMGRVGYVRPERSLADGGDYQKLRMLPHPSHPVRLVAKQKLELPLELGAHRKAAPRNPLLSILSSDPLGTVSLNGKKLLAAGKWEDQWQDFHVPGDLPHPGINQLAFELPALSPSQERQWEEFQPKNLLQKNFKNNIWSLAPGSKRTLASVEKDSLKIDDQGKIPGDYRYAKALWFADPEALAVAEVEFKLLSGKNGILIANGKYEEAVWLYPDHIMLEWCKQRIPVEMDDNFQNLRLELKGNDFRLVLNGKEIFAAKNILVDPPHGARNSLSFGAANSNTLGAALWKNVRFKAKRSSALLYDAVLRQF